MKFIKYIAEFPLLVILICCGSRDSKIETTNNTLPKTINYLALGDSYTIGEGVAEKDRWPNQLANELKKLDTKIDTVKIIAKTGWTTTNLLEALENEKIEGYNLVSLLIGVNNQYQKKPFSIFEIEFKMLLDKSIAFAGVKNNVFVVSIPDYGVTPFGSNNKETIEQELNAYNEFMSNQCNEKGIPFINITDISRNLGSSEGALAPDNLHPSGDQYSAWVSKILPVVSQLTQGIPKKD